MSRLSLFQKRINNEIPLSEALGIRLISWDGHALLLAAPWSQIVTTRVPDSVVASILLRLPPPGA